MSTTLGNGIPSVEVKTLKPLGQDNYDVLGMVNLNYSAVVSSLENPSDEDLEEIKAEMQRAFEDGILDLAVLILKKWDEGLWPIVSRMDLSKDELTAILTPIQ